MNDPLYFCVADHGRVSVMSQFPMSPRRMVATALCETEARALASVLNNQDKTVRDLISEVRRERAARCEVVRMLRELVESQRVEDGKTPTNDQFVRNGKAIRETLALLAVIDGRDVSVAAHWIEILPGE